MVALVGHPKSIPKSISENNGLASYNQIQISDRCIYYHIYDEQCRCFTHYPQTFGDFLVEEIFPGQSFLCSQFYATPLVALRNWMFPALDYRRLFHRCIDEIKDNVEQTNG